MQTFQKTNKIATTPTLAELIACVQPRLTKVYSTYLNPITADDLKSAMRYTLQNGGKYLRPLLIYATGRVFGAPWENCDVPACSVELIHTYSLIHDDLPCMDNADLRRNQPTCHKVYGDGMAVLTGDALHTLAIQILATHPATLTDQQRLEMIKTLSIACGPFGMAAGQALDITLLHRLPLETDLLLDIYHLKTGALLTACVELGWLCSNDRVPHHQQALKTFGEHIGLAFQIQDDILDIESSTEQAGKPQGIDHQNNKMTFPTLHGIAAAKAQVTLLYEKGLASIRYLGKDAQLLRDLSAFMLKRQQ